MRNDKILYSSSSSFFFPMLLKGKLKSRMIAYKAGTDTHIFFDNGIKKIPEKTPWIGLTTKSKIT